MIVQPDFSVVQPSFQTYRLYPLPSFALCRLLKRSEVGSSQVNLDQTGQVNFICLFILSVEGSTMSNTASSKEPKKKVKKNACIYYAEQRRREEEAKGMKLPARAKELVEYFSHEWEKMDEAARAPYKAMAARSAITTNTWIGEAPIQFPIKSTGKMPKRKPINLSMSRQVEGKEMDESLREETIRFDLMPLLDPNVGDPRDHVFVLINFSIYCFSDMTATAGFYPGEVGLTAFSLRRGVFDNFCTLIDPGHIPLGFAADTQHYRITQGLPDPPFDSDCQNYEKILSSIDNFIASYPTYRKGCTYLFCVRSEMDKVKGCLKWLCERSDHDRLYYIYPYGLLLQNLANIGQGVYAIQKMRGLSEEETETLNVGDPTGILDNGRLMSRRIPHSTKHELAQLEIEPNSSSDYNSYNGVFREGFCDQFYGTNNELFSIDEDNEANEAAPASEKPYKDSRVFMFEALADEFLRSQDMAHCAELACPHHMVNSDKVDKCPLSICNRHAYNSLDILVQFWGIIPIEGYHFPQRNPDKEMFKRRSILALRGVHGHEGLEGFEDSVDSQFDELSKDDIFQYTIPVDPESETDEDDSSRVINIAKLREEILQESNNALKKTPHSRHYFDGIRRSFGRGVRAQLPEESLDKYVQRQTYLRYLRQTIDHQKYLDAEDEDDEEPARQVRTKAPDIASVIAVWDSEEEASFRRREEQFEEIDEVKFELATACEEEDYDSFEEDEEDDTPCHPSYEDCVNLYYESTILKEMKEMEEEGKDNETWNCKNKAATYQRRDSGDDESPTDKSRDDEEFRLY